MLDWVKDNLLLIVILLSMLAGGYYTYGELNHKVDSLDKDVVRLEIKIDDMSRTLYRLEGAYGTANNPAELPSDNSGSGDNAH